LDTLMTKGLAVSLAGSTRELASDEQGFECHALAPIHGCPGVGASFFLKICRRTDSQIAQYERCNRHKHAGQPQDTPKTLRLCRCSDCPPEIAHRHG
jgi:hypothetical protein